MIYKLICAGEDSFSKLYKKDIDEVIIAIDGGYQTLKDNNVNIDYFFGDFDSLDNNDVICDNKYSFSPIKDDSDFDLALNYLVNELKIDKDDYIYVYNCTGGRLDHYYAIINSLKKYCDYKIILFNENNKIYIASNIFHISKTNYKYISFFSLNDNTIISISGCKYNISNYNLKEKDNLCLSNEILEKATIKTNNRILIFETK